MNKEEILNKYRRSVEIIGSNIQIYGHFDVYSIPDINGKGLRSNTTLEELLSSIENHYNNKKSINYDYGDDLKEQNSVKRFILKRINEESFNIGLKWIYNEYLIKVDN